MSDIDMLSLKNSLCNSVEHLIKLLKPHSKDHLLECLTTIRDELGIAILDKDKP